MTLLGWLIATVGALVPYADNLVNVPYLEVGSGPLKAVAAAIPMFWPVSWLYSTLAIISGFGQHFDLAVARALARKTQLSRVWFGLAAIIALLAALALLEAEAFLVVNYQFRPNTTVFALGPLLYGISLLSLNLCFKWGRRGAKL